MNLLCKLGLHYKSSLTYIKSYPEFDSGFWYLVAVYDISCPRCGKYKETSRVFPFDNYQTITRRKEMKLKHPDYPIGYTTLEDAEIAAINFKGN